MKPPSWREEMYANLAGWLLMKIGVMAYKRHDLHRFKHIRAALQRGDMSEESHKNGCRLDPAGIVVVMNKNTRAHHG